MSLSHLKEFASSAEQTTIIKKTVAAPVSDLATGERFENGIRIKTLPPSVVKDIEQKNIARRLAAISPIQIRVRRCLACGFMFESSGNRTCGCSSRSSRSAAEGRVVPVAGF
ncbi:MAG: hypothetical protein V4591_08215, partial [Bdellovibrionota bacterium]